MPQPAPGRQGALDDVAQGAGRTFLFISIAAVATVIGLFVPFLVAIWVIAATFVAVRQALDYADTFRAMVVCLLGSLVGVVVVYVTGLGATVLH